MALSLELHDPTCFVHPPLSPFAGRYWQCNAAACSLNIEIIAASGVARFEYLERDMAFPSWRNKVGHGHEGYRDMGVCLHAMW